MKKALSVAAIVAMALVVSVIGFSESPLAYDATEWYGKEGQDEKSYYMDSALSKLPPEKAEAFRSTMIQVHEDNEDLQKQITQLHGDLHTILTAPTFDRDAFLAKREEIQKLHNQMEKDRTEAFASAVSELSQKERIILTRDLRHSHMKHH